MHLVSPQKQPRTGIAAYPPRLWQLAHMFKLGSLAEIEAIAENFEVECKLAAGRDGKGTVYYLLGHHPITPEQAFAEVSPMTVSAKVSSGHNGISSGHNGISSGHNGVSSGHNGDSPMPSKRDEYGCLVVHGLPKPLIDKLDLLEKTVKQELISIAQECHRKQRMHPDEMVKVLLLLCENYYVTQQVLAKLVNRQPETLRKNRLKALLDHGDLTLAFPTVPTHPSQAYTCNNNKKLED